MINNKISFKHICKEDTYMFNYTQLPDELFTVNFFKDLSLHAKVLYSFMLRRVSVSKENCWIDEVGDVYIYYRTDEIMEKFNCSNKTASKIMSELEDIGLIDKVRQGQGKPDIIYVNKFSAVIADAPSEQDSGEEPELIIDHSENDFSRTGQQTVGESTQNSEVKNLHIQKCKNYTSRNVKSTLLEVKNLHANYIENNYKELVNSSSNQRLIEHNGRVRLLEEEIEDLKHKIKYCQAERVYSARITAAVFAELTKREKEYRDKFTAEMFLKTCKSIKASREPIVNLPGFINWCLDHISYFPASEGKQQGNQFNQFMQREYDYKKLEEELLMKQNQLLEKN